MKKIIIIFITTIHLTLSATADLGIYSEKNDLRFSYKGNYNIYSGLKLTYEPALDIKNLDNIYLNISLEKDIISQSIFGKINHLFTDSKKIPTEAIFGLKIPLKNKIFLSLGILTQETKLVNTYLSLSYKIADFQTYFSLSNKIKVGIYYGINILKQKNINEYFTIISPHNDSKTNKKFIYIKGYYLDKGKIYLNNKPITLNADGMFIEKIHLPRIGKHKISFFISGKNTKEYEQKITIKRIYPYIDLDLETQNKWLPLLDYLEYPKETNFNPYKKVKRKEFYKLLAKLTKIKKGQYHFNDYFIDVEDTELREYLFSYYGTGLLKVPYKNFLPETFIKRQEALTVISRILPEQDTLDQFNFIDVPYSNWFYIYANKLKNYNLIKSDNVYPQKNLSRQDLYTIMNRLISLLDLNMESCEQVNKQMKETQTTITLDQSQFSRKNLRFLNKLSNIRVKKPIFAIKGYGPSGMTFKVNSNNVKVTNLNRFAESISLKPGLNKITIQTIDSKFSFMVLYLKKFQDLSSDDHFTDIIEKIATLGYLDLKEDVFYPEKYITKAELIKSLIKIGVIKNSKLKKLKDPEELVSYQDALQIINKSTNSNIPFNPAYGEELSRKTFTILLYEIPEIKQQVQSFYVN